MSMTGSKRRPRSCLMTFETDSISQALSVTDAEDFNPKAQQRHRGNRGSLRRTECKSSDSLRSLAKGTEGFYPKGIHFRCDTLCLDDKFPLIFWAFSVRSPVTTPSRLSPQKSSRVRISSKPSAGIQDSSLYTNHFRYISLVRISLCLLD